MPGGECPSRRGAGWPVILRKCFPAGSVIHAPDAQSLVPGVRAAKFIMGLNYLGVSSTDTRVVLGGDCPFCPRCVEEGISPEITCIFSSACRVVPGTRSRLVVYKTPMIRLILRVPRPLAL